jgi:hypothetical protein
MKEEKSSWVYVLADYKQLVLQYKTKFSQQARQALVWKVVAIWCAIVIFAMGAAMYFWVTDARRSFADSKNDIGKLSLRLQEFAVRLDETQQELKVAKEELKFKSEAIGRLEQGISSASKRLVENLLRTRQ